MKTHLLPSIILSVYLFFNTVSYGQVWTNYTVSSTSNGLPSNTVRAVASDRNGNMWFGTPSGVTKFDGLGWTTYTAANGLANNNVTCLAVDLYNNIWAGTNSGLSKFNGSTWVSYTTVDGLVWDKIKSISIDRLGNIWIGASEGGGKNNGGISKFDGKTWTSYTTKDGLLCGVVNVVFADPIGNIWIGMGDNYYSGGVSKFNGTTFTSYTTTNGLVNNTINSIAMDSLGYKWFGTTSYINGGVSKFDGSVFINFTQNYLNYCVYAIATEVNNVVWFGTEKGGIYRYEGNNWTNTNVSCIYAIAIDKDNNKWFGTSSGVTKLQDSDPNQPKIRKACVNENFKIGISSYGDFRWQISTDEGLHWENLTNSSVYYGVNNDTLTIMAINSSFNNYQYRCVINGGAQNDTLGRIILSVNELPNVSIDAVSEICSGDTVTLKANGANTYLWSNGQTSNIWYSTPSATTEYTVTGTSDKGCRNSASVTVNVKPSPLVTIAQHDTTLLIGSSMVLNAYGAQTYTWNNGISNGISFIPTTTKSYTVIGTGNNGCKGYAGITVSVNTITDFPQEWRNFSVFDGYMGGTAICLAVDAKNNKWIGSGNGVFMFDGFNFTNYTTSNGLVSNIVTAIAIDNQGNKWFGTNMGVSMFNGTKWVTYNTSNGLVSNYISAIAIDKQGNKWFGTNSGVSRFDGTNWTTYSNTNGIPANRVYCITIDKQGNRWFGIESGGAVKFDGTNWTKYTKTNGLTADSVLCISEDVSGNLWFGTNNGMAVFNGNSWVKYYSINGLTDESVKNILIDKANNIWLGTYNGVVKFDGSNWKTYTTTDGLASNVIYSGVVDNNGVNWFGTYLGFSTMSIKISHPQDLTVCSESNTFFAVKTPIPGNTYQWQVGINYTWSNISDNANYTGANTDTLRIINLPVSFNNYYYRCLIKGIINLPSKYAKLIVNPSPIITISAAKTTVYLGAKTILTASGANTYYWNNGISNGVAFAPTQTKTYTVAGTASNGCTSVSQATVTVLPTTQKWVTYNRGISFGYAPNPMTNIRAIVVDDFGVKWYGTLSGVYKYDGVTWKSYHTSDGLAGDYVYAIAIDKGGNKWFGTNNGVSKFDGVNWTNYTTADGLISNTVYAIAVDSLGNKWFGTNAGVSQFSSGNDWTSYTISNGLLSNTVNTVVVDAKNNKWFGTSAGISGFNGTSWINYTTANGLPNNVVNTLIMDKYSNLWCGTSLGIAKFNGNSWLEVFGYNKNWGRIYDYNVKASVIDKLGNIWFGGNENLIKCNGISCVHFNWDNDGVKVKQVYAIAIDIDGSALLSADNGYYRFFEKLISNKVYSVAFDKNNNKWFGTDIGISMYTDSTWANYCTDSAVFSAAVDASNIRWFGRYGKVIGFDNNKWQILHRDSIMNVKSIQVDSKGNKWFAVDAYEAGVFMYDNKNYTRYTTKNGLVNNYVTAIAIDAQGNKWIGTRGGVSKFDGFGWVTYTTANGLVSNTIRDIAIDVQGNKWFATDNGVSKFTGVDWVSYKETSGGLVSNSVFSVTIDSYGNKWFGTNKGVSKFDNASFVTYTDLDGLAHNQVNDIGVDAQNNKWFCTDGGVTLFNETGAAPSLSVSSNSLFISAPANSSVNFDVLSNTNWTISCPEPWLNIDKTYGSGIETIKLTALANTSGANRDAVVTVSDGGIVLTINVTQITSSTAIEYTKKQVISCYPNPITNWFTITGLNSGSSVTVYNMAGKMVFSKLAEGETEQFDFSNLVVGMYILNISNSNQTIKVKLVKK